MLFRSTEDITYDATTIYLDDVSSLSPAGFIRVGEEIISYSSIVQDTNAVSGQLLFCGRGQQNTIAAAHLTDAAVYRTQPPAVTVWPVPDSSQVYQLVYWRLRRTQDAGGGVNVMDVPFRFIPAMAAGLAYYIAGKIPEGAERIQMLKQQYDEAWDLAAYEDHEKAALRFVPRQQFIGNTI